MAHIVKDLISRCCRAEIARGYFSGDYVDRCVECCTEYYVGTGSMTLEEQEAEKAYQAKVALAFEALEFVRHLRNDCTPDEAVDLLTNTDRFDEEEEW